jgi:hypothetical protein
MRRRDIALHVKIALRQGKTLILPGGGGKVGGYCGLESNRTYHQAGATLLVLAGQALQCDQSQQAASCWRQGSHQEVPGADGTLTLPWKKPVVQAMGRSLGSPLRHLALQGILLIRLHFGRGRGILL